MAMGKTQTRSTSGSQMIDFHFTHKDFTQRRSMCFCAIEA
jgi:hypothetical protein